MIDIFLEAVKNNPEFSAVLIAFLLDIGAGMIPDKYVAYIGLVRRILRGIMKRKETKMLLIIVLLFTVGCAYMQPSSVCDTDERSLICEKIPQPEHADIALQLVNVRALKNDYYSAQKVLKFFDMCESFLEKDVTYGVFVKWLGSYIEDVELEVVILSNYLNVLKVDIPISDYDRMLLQEHIERQKEIVQMYMEQ